VPDGPVPSLMHKETGHGRLLKVARSTLYYRPLPVSGRSAADALAGRTVSQDPVLWRPAYGGGDRGRWTGWSGLALAAWRTVTLPNYPAVSGSVWR
jgi:hypothetical protein